MAPKNDFPAFFINYEIIIRLFLRDVKRIYASVAAKSKFLFDSNEKSDTHCDLFWRFAKIFAVSPSKRYEVEALSAEITPIK